MSNEIARRRRAGCLSWWELGDLLGIHPHQLHNLRPGELPTQQPIAVLIELCQRLDIHPADLVADLDPVLTNRRLPAQQPTAANPDDHHPHDGHHGGHADGHRRAGPADDALTVLTGLAHARTPLRVEDLAAALAWRLGRVQTALDYAREHPTVGGPLTLRRVPPETFTVTPRLDVLTAGAHQKIHNTGSWYDILAENEALVLLGALAYGRGPTYAEFRDNDPYRHAEATLKQAGILYSDYGPHHVAVTDDVLYSLRYRDDAHIARDRGERTSTL